MDLVVSDSIVPLSQGRGRDAIESHGIHRLLRDSEKDLRREFTLRQPLVVLLLVLKD